jgi:hypothetical protein
MPEESVLEHSGMCRAVNGQLLDACRETPRPNDKKQPRAERNQERPLQIRPLSEKRLDIIALQESHSTAYQCPDQTDHGTHQKPADMLGLGGDGLRLANSLNLVRHLLALTEQKISLNNS